MALYQTLKVQSSLVWNYSKGQYCKDTWKMQNTLSAKNVAETEWGFGQDRKDNPVPKKPAFKSLSGISLSGHAG